MSRFQWAIRAEFATMHLMHEQGLKGPIDLFLSLGYDLQLNDKDKWNAIQKEYDMDIRRCLKQKFGDREGFKFRPLGEMEGE